MQTCQYRSNKTTGQTPKKLLRKKKTYTKPKKIKHKRKKVKLAVLKFYKVDSNDKVTRLRRECPHETCGPGVFMAMHFNRYYCGKCHLTYLIKKEEEDWADLLCTSAASEPQSWAIIGVAVLAGRLTFAMRLFVRDVAGTTHCVEPAATESVASLKERLAGVQCFPSAEQCLIFGGRSLRDEELIGECGVDEESTIWLTAELSGGGKKRKKKTYTKPKKIKHKRKKVKLAVLKFYKVDSNDKVTRLRRECPHETCGPGVFMAMHFNRYYCGKCHLTYLIKKEDK
ncbi:ubl-1 [Symbiodinium natans]|uniref:Ubl-1 protein n=1 Tax=Symbiodinium natans TaxID=878477 RepID=A0A812RXV6_9DINO|nr:ubl-1 [Symbiodinium natans]